MAVGLAGPNIAIFIEPMTRELGWSPSTFGWAQMARLEAVIVAGPLIGRAIDRHGPRLLVAIAGAVTAALVISLAYVQQEWQLIAIFFLTGLLGMGRAADLFVTPPIAKWFVRRRGLALGIGLTGTPLGVAIFYPLSQFTIDAIGWRDAWLVFGIAGLVIIPPIALIFLRRQPEDLGLLPDGAAADATAIDSAIEISWTRAQAIRTVRFWILVAGFTLFTYGWSTITIYRVPHFIERGLDPSLVAIAIATDAVVAILASIYLGRLSKRVAPRYLFAIGAAGLIVSATSLVYVHSIALLFIANLGYGFGFQTGHVAQNLIWANYYGRVHLGAIAGISLPVTIGLGAFAYPVTGLIRDSAGYYTPAWIIAAAILLVASITLVAVKPPTNQS
jgi:MFS family permease